MAELILITVIEKSNIDYAIPEIIPEINNFEQVLPRMLKHSAPIFSSCSASNPYFLDSSYSIFSVALS